MGLPIAFKLRPSHFKTSHVSDACESGPHILRLPVPVTLHAICLRNLHVLCAKSYDEGGFTRRRSLGEKTLAVSVRHYDGTLEYDAHNLYPLFQAVATAHALQRLRGKRSFILSRRAIGFLGFFLCM